MKTPSKTVQFLLGALLCGSFAALFMVALDDLFGAGVGVAIGAGLWVALFSPSGRKCSQQPTTRHD